MTHERIVVTTHTRDLEGVLPKTTEAILANSNPKFLMFLDECPKAVAGDACHEQMRADYRALDDKPD